MPVQNSELKPLWYMNKIVFDFVVMMVINLFVKCLKLISKISVSAFNNNILCQHPF